MGFYKPGTARPVPLTEFAPDKPVLEPGILLDAVGAQPTTAGFAPLPNLVGLAPALLGRPLGSHFAYYSNQARTLFAAIDTGASAVEYFVLDSAANAWVLVTGPSSSFPVPVRFAQFGDDVLTVGNFSSPDGVWIAPNKASNFVTIPGSPPNATVIVVVGNQVVVFVDDNWFTSAAGNDTDWTLSLATRADTGVLTDAPGPVVAAAPLYRTIFVFKQNVVYLGTQSFPSAFDFQMVSTSTGTWSQGCVIPTPSAVYFLGIDDFYVTTGYAPERLPNSVKSWFFRTVDPNYLQNTLGWLDQDNSVLYWHFVSKDAPLKPTCDRFVSYNIRARRWCVGRLDVSSVPYLSMPTNALPNPGTAAIVIDSKYVPKAFTQFPSNMVLTTGYYGNPGRLSQLMRLLPLYNRAPCEQTLTPLCTDVLGQPDKQSEPATLGVDGWFYTRQYERYHKVVLGMKGDCEITALVPELREGGLWGYGVDVPCPDVNLTVSSQFTPTNDLGQKIVPEMSATLTVVSGPHAAVIGGIQSEMTAQGSVACSDVTERGQQSITIQTAFDQESARPAGNNRSSWGMILNGELYSMIGTATCGGGNMPYTNTCCQINHFKNDNSAVFEILALPIEGPLLPSSSTRIGSSDCFVWNTSNAAHNGPRLWYDQGNSFVDYVLPTVNFGGHDFDGYAIKGNEVWMHIPCCRDAGPPNTQFIVFNKTTGAKLHDYFTFGNDNVTIANMQLTAGFLYCKGSLAGVNKLYRIDRTTGAISATFDLNNINPVYVGVASDDLIYLLCSGTPASVYYVKNFTDIIYVGKTAAGGFSPFNQGTGIWNNGTFYYGSNGFAGFDTNVRKIVVGCTPGASPVVATISVAESTVAHGGTVHVTFGTILLPDATDRLVLMAASSSLFSGTHFSTVSTGGVASGSGVAFTIPGGTAPGTYKIALATNLGNMFIANSNTFTVT